MPTDFPIQKEWPERFFPPQLAAIPWALIARHEAQALKNHGGQSLIRLAERLGLSAEEAVAVIEDKDYCARWKRTDGTREGMNVRSVEAINCLRELVEQFHREQTAKLNEVADSMREAPID